MSWDNHHPAHNEPKVPQSVRDFCWQRDEGLCQLGYDGCTGVGQELDHVRGVAELGYRDDRPENLQWVCRYCHKLKTQQQRWGTQHIKRERHPALKRKRMTDAPQAKASGRTDGSQSRSRRSSSRSQSVDDEVRQRPRPSAVTE